MITVYKYRLDYENGKECFVSLPSNHNWLHVGFQGDSLELCLWAAVDTESPVRKRKFLVAMTGQDLGLTEDEFLNVYQYIGSCTAAPHDGYPGAMFVLHVWAAREKAFL